MVSFLDEELGITHDNHGISTLNGKQFCTKDLLTYIGVIRHQINFIRDNPNVSLPCLDREREKIHNEILRVAKVERGSEFDIKLKNYIEKYFQARNKEIVKYRED